MDLRTWARVVLAAVGAGLLAGTAQLGLAYGLGLVRFARDFGGNGRDEWAAQLTWLVWIAMLAAVAGTVAGDRRARRFAVGGPGPVSATLLGGGLAAAAMASMAALPARAAVLPGVATASVAGVSVLLAAVVGVLAGGVVLARRVAGWNVAAVSATVWLLALVSVAPSLGGDNASVIIRLGVFEPAWLSAHLVPRIAVVTMAAVALVAAAVVGAVARRRGVPPVAAAASGLAGPALLAVAYLIAGVGGGGDRLQDAPYFGALVALSAGLLGALLAVLVHRGEPTPEPARQPAGTPTPEPARQPTGALLQTPVGRPSPPEPAADSYRPPRETYGRPEEGYGRPEEGYGQRPGNLAPPRENYRPAHETNRPAQESYRPAPETYGPPQESHHRAEQGYGTAQQYRGSSAARRSPAGAGPANWTPPAAPYPPPAEPYQPTTSYPPTAAEPYQPTAGYQPARQPYPPTAAAYPPAVEPFPATAGAANVPPRRPAVQPYVPNRPRPTGRGDSFARPPEPAAPPAVGRTAGPDTPLGVGRAVGPTAAPVGGVVPDASGNAGPDTGGTDPGERHSRRWGTGGFRRPKPAEPGEPAGIASPAPDGGTGGRRGAPAAPDDEYVNWVSGLGGGPDDQRG